MVKFLMSASFWGAALLFLMCVWNDAILFWGSAFTKENTGTGINWFFHIWKFITLCDLFDTSCWIYIKPNQMTY